MATQFDFQPGVDLTGLTSVTKAQLTQLVGQIAPLSNIAGVYVGPSAPDTANNSRFLRYIWLDNTDSTNVLLKIYSNGAWTTVTVADNSITAAQLTAFAVTLLQADNVTPNIAYRYTADTVPAKANYLLRLDSNGQYVEIVSAYNVVNGVSIEPSSINNSSASEGWILMKSGGATVWAALSISSLLTSNSVSLDKLAYGSAGTAGYLLRANSVAPYDIQLVQNNDQAAGLFAANSIPLSKLYDSSYASGRKLVGNGSAFVGSTPYYASQQTLNNATLAGNNAHGLGSMPNILQGFVVCTSTDLGYAAGDKVAISSVFTAGGVCAISVWADATTVRFSKFANSGLEMRPAAGGASAAIDESKWDLYIYASL